MSEVFYFSGRVIPDHLPLSVSYSPNFKRESRIEDEPVCFMEVKISSGKFRVTVEVEKYTDQVAIALFQASLDAAQRLADTAGFIRAVPYQVVVDFIEKPDGTTTPLALGDTHLRRLGSFSSEHTEAIADLLIGDFAFGQAMSDLMAMLNKTHYAPISYGRVTESIARLVAPSLPPKAMWAKTRSELCVSEAFLRKLTDVSTDPRHGTRTPVSGEENRKLSEMAWRLMDRYVHYRLSDGVLPEQEFPELTV